MQVENQQFLQIIARKQTQNLAAEVVQSVAPEAAASTQVTSVVEELLAKNTEATIYSIADEAAKMNSSSQSSETILGQLNMDLVQPTGNVNYVTSNSAVTDNSDIIGTISQDIISEKTFAITIEDMSPSRIANIKQIIYDLHFKDTDPEEPTDPTDPTDPEDPDVDPDDPYIPEEDDDPKPSFIDEFDDVETMFDWMHEQDPTISKTKGVTREQLIQFTQNDDWEDANSDFFGALNRVFDVLNTDGDEYLTVDEIKAMIGEEIGTSSSAYLSKVASYAAQLDAEYESLDMLGKLEFAIEKTRDYLEAMGMTEQIEALDRLLAGTDTYNEIHIGQIAFADLNTDEDQVGTTLGAYRSIALQGTYNGMNWAVYVSDYDTEDSDCGLTLDINYYSNASWYELVDTLVHELTHATAYQYTHLDEEGSIYYVDQSLIDKLHEAGALTSSEYSYYSANINNLIEEELSYGDNCGYQTGVFNVEELNRFYYLIYTMWGEYSAYQTDADYADSIGADVLDGSNVINTAVNGSQEKDTIEDHIDQLYNHDGYVESVPDWKWWTYA